MNFLKTSSTAIKASLSQARKKLAPTHVQARDLSKTTTAKIADEFRLSQKQSKPGKRTIFGFRKQVDVSVGELKARQAAGQTPWHSIGTAPVQPPQQQPRIRKSAERDVYGRDAIPVAQDVERDITGRKPLPAKTSLPPATPPPVLFRNLDTGFELHVRQGTRVRLSPDSSLLKSPKGFERVDSPSGSSVSSNGNAEEISGMIAGRETGLSPGAFASPATDASGVAQNRRRVTFNLNPADVNQPGSAIHSSDSVLAGMSSIQLPPSATSSRVKSELHPDRSIISDVSADSGAVRLRKPLKDMALFREHRANSPN